MAKTASSTNPEQPGLKAFGNDFDFAPFIEYQGELAWSYHKALLFQRLSIFYSLIPKNACTSLLSALARESGLSTPWFHSNNRIHNVERQYSAFTNLDAFHDDTFKIIAFRNPFKRVMSAINDKLVGTQEENRTHQRYFEKRLGKDIGECRLSEIFRLVDRNPHWTIDKHFAPQWSFVFYDRYDLVIDADARIDWFDVGERRIKLGHQNRKRRAHLDEDLGDATIAEIRSFFKQHGQMPSMPGQHAVFSNSIRIGGNYERDYKLYDALG